MGYTVFNQIARLTALYQAGAYQSGHFIVATVLVNGLDQSVCSLHTLLSTIIQHVCGKPDREKNEQYLSHLLARKSYGFVTISEFHVFALLCYSSQTVLTTAAMSRLSTSVGYGRHSGSISASRNCSQPSLNVDRIFELAFKIGLDGGL